MKRDARQKQVKENESEQVKQIVIAKPLHARFKAAAAGVGLSLHEAATTAVTDWLTKHSRTA